MDKCYTRLGATAFIAAVLLIIVMAASTVNTYAEHGDSYSAELAEGVSTEFTWGTTYDSDAVTYFKINPSKKGTITFAADFYCYVSLCDADLNVKSIGSYSSGDIVNPDSSDPATQIVHYGVKKGTTYYLRVKNMPSRKDSQGNYVGIVKYTGSKVAPSKCGKSKKKAKAIKKNKKAKGLFIGGNKKAQWFKITNKQKKTKMILNASKINNSLNFKVYYKSYGHWYNRTVQLNRQTGYNKHTLVGTISMKVNHTYYIKVSPEGKTSGAYTIKWK